MSPASVLHHVDNVGQEPQEHSHAEPPSNRVALVSLALLTLVIAGGVWFLRSGELTPEEMLSRARELVDGDQGPGWIRARREYLEPLLALDPERWSDEVEPLLFTRLREGAGR